jgi:hypothetical protein
MCQKQEILTGETYMMLIDFVECKNYFINRTDSHVTYKLTHRFLAHLAKGKV